MTMQQQIFWLKSALGVELLVLFVPDLLAPIATLVVLTATLAVLVWKLAVHDSVWWEPRKIRKPIDIAWERHCRKLIVKKAARRIRKRGKCKPRAALFRPYTRQYFDQ